MSSPAPTSALQAGWLGLGAMGAPLVRRLAGAGHRVTAYDPTPGRARELGDDVLEAASAAETAESCDVLFVMVATPAQAEAALFATNGAAASLPADSRVVLLSTLGPAWVRSLSARLPEGTRVIDAPVSGGVARARDGSLLIMAAGAQDSDRELLSALGEVVDVGDEPGQGQAMKMVNQVLCGIHIAASAEALALAARLGIDPGLAWNTVRRGAGASFMLEDRGSRMVLGEREPVRSSLSLFVKDLGLVLDEAGAVQLPTPVVAATAQLFAAAASDGHSSHDDTELYDFVRSLGSS